MAAGALWVALVESCGAEDASRVIVPEHDAAADAQLEGGAGGQGGSSGVGGLPEASADAPEADVPSEADAWETPLDAPPDAFDAPAEAKADTTVPSGCEPVSPPSPTSGGVDCAGCWGPGTAPPGYGSGGAQCDQINLCGAAGIKVGSGGFSDWTVIFPKSNEWDGGNPCPVACQVAPVFRFDVVGSCVRFSSSTPARRFSTSKAGGCIAPLSTCLVASAGSSVYVYASSSAPLGWVRAETVGCAAACP